MEASSMAEYTRQLVKQNSCEEVVTVLRGRAEEIELPEQVDVLVSEWMGNCLLVTMTIHFYYLCFFSIIVYLILLDTDFPVD